MSFALIANRTFGAQTSAIPVFSSLSSGIYAQRVLRKLLWRGSRRHADCPVKACWDRWMVEGCQKPLSECAYAAPHERLTADA